MVGLLLIAGFIFFRPEKTEQQIESSSPPVSVSEKTIEEAIALALSEKNNWDKSQVEVHVAEVEGEYARGDVKFVDEMGGGLWFAMNVGGTWQIVYDGNGVITCDQLTKYESFPTTFIPQCYDTDNEEMVER